MTLRIGHRGAKAYVDENTIESFRKALSLKCDMIELDVRKCKSGEIVLMHDKKVDRTTDDKAFVKELTLEQIKRLRTKSNYKVPTLDQALKFLKAKCGIIIDLKEDVCEEVNQLIRKHKIEKEVIVSSYNPAILLKIKKQNPKIRTALLARHHLRLIKKAKDIGCYSIHPRLRLPMTKWFIDKAHKNNLKINVWVVNWKFEISMLKKIGVDGIISDYPDHIL